MTEQATKESATMRKLLATLKRHNPHHVVAYGGDSDDEGRKIAIPTRRRKWSSVIEAIEARPWSRVELLDKSGAVLGYVDNDGEPGELETLGAPRALAGQAGQVQLAERIYGMCRAAANDALTHRRAEVDAILNASTQVVSQMTDAMRGLVDALRSASDVKQDAAEVEREAAIAAAQNADGDQMRQLVEALPMILQALPALRGMLKAS